MRILAATILIFLFFSCKEESAQSKPESDDLILVENPTKDTIHEVDKSIYEVKTIENPLGWGYEVWKDGAMVINQTHIPAVQGVRAFSSKEQAQKAAEIIKSKLDQGIFPPTISLEELQSIGIDTK